VPRSVVVGIIQAAPRRSKKETLEAVDKLLRGAREPSILVMPEYLMLDPTGLNAAKVAEAAEDLEGPWISFFREKAEELGSCIAATFFEKGAGGRVFNSLALIDGKGRIVGVYRKTHLFDAYGFRESTFTAPGDRLLEPLDFCGVKVGVAICFEIRFPEIFRRHAIAGAEMALVPAAWYRGPLKEETLRFLSQARAHENTLFLVVASNPGSNFVGRSMVVDPMGVVRVDLGPGEKYQEVKVDLDEVVEARKTLPVLRLRRPELYG